MFQGIYNFVRRNRRKFMITGVLAGGALVASNYVLKKFNEWKEEQIRSYLDRVKKEQFHQRTLETCIATTQKLLIRLKTTINDQLDTEAVQLRLKDDCPNRLELWEELKILSFTKVYTQIYSTSLLLIFCQVQFAILSSYVFNDSKRQAMMDDDEKEFITMVSARVQEMYLKVVHFFIETGLVSLIERVRKCVEQEWKSISLKKMMVFSDVQEHMKNVTKSVFKFDSIENVNSYLLTLLIPNDSTHIETDIRDEIIYSKMITETIDVLDNSDALSLIYLIIESSEDILFNTLIVSFENVQSDSFINPNSISLPVAKIIPRLCHIVSFDGNIMNEYLDNATQNFFLKTYATNIFESFCSSSVNGNNNFYES